MEPIAGSIIGFALGGVVGVWLGRSRAVSPAPNTTRGTTPQEEDEQ